MASFKIWIGASAADTITRLALQLGSTMVMARILSAEEFGLASMVLGVNTVMAAFIGLPFEESLAQRRQLYTTHLETVLFVSGILTLLSMALSAVFGPIIENFANAPGFAVALIVSSLLLFAQGPGAVARAMARRHRRFVDLSICNAVSTALACVVAVMAAFSGWGVYALILQRLLPNLFFPMLAAGFMGLGGKRVLLPLRWHATRFRELFRFSWLHLANVGVTNSGPATLAFLVNAYFGQAILGQWNIALRIVDPLRMALMGVGHNLAFSALVRLQLDARKLTAKAGEIALATGFIIIPAFAGLAVATHVLLPMLVGPGWEGAVPLSQMLCLGVGLSLPFRFYFSGYSALGRPEYGLISSIFALVSMVAIFMIATDADIHNAAGVAFIASEAATVVTAVGFATFLIGRAIMPIMFRMLRIWIGALIMAAVVWSLFLSGPEVPVTLPRLAAIILTGMAIYPMAMLVVCRRCLTDFIGLIRGK
ncbi:oligosaccharide flippase family protein [Paracoccus aerodenitrificans]|uniref:oligosaccharide flippase family protein n=1 Tax=Paracoccus aerodenitrificans TaxID=3017781 RepID=UPI0022F005A2|nr:oligosaccharide flippase family protein [Paracoccus aerodenitrificans]WBU63493.1 oligosaccharide flippase family protein [Paracoccus aerodenitrificans]